MGRNHENENMILCSEIINLCIKKQVEFRRQDDMFSIFIEI